MTMMEKMKNMTMIIRSVIRMMNFSMISIILRCCDDDNDDDDVQSTLFLFQPESPE